MKNYRHGVGLSRYHVVGAAENTENLPGSYIYASNHREAADEYAKRHGSGRRVLQALGYDVPDIQIKGPGESGIAVIMQFKFDDPRSKT